MKVESHNMVRFCKYCRSDHIRREGVRKNKSGIVQRFKCGETFSTNFGF